MFDAITSESGVNVAFDKYTTSNHEAKYRIVDECNGSYGTLFNLISTVIFFQFQLSSTGAIL
jgi:hypothetical protein